MKSYGRSAGRSRVSHVGLRLAVAWGVPLLCAVAPRGHAQQSIHVGPNVQVSSALPAVTHFEMIVAADPEHTERLMACSMAFPLAEPNSLVETYASVDSGRTWFRALETRGATGGGYRESWDPDCAYGPGGAGYSLSEGIDSLNRSYDRIDRSDDGGRTWVEPAFFKHAERSFMSIDWSSGVRRGWMYIHGSGSSCVPGSKCLHGDATRVMATADGGRTIVGESEVPSDSLGENPFTGRGVVLTDGTAIMPTIESTAEAHWGNLPLYNALGVNRQPANANFWVLRVTDARKSWPLTIDKVKVSDVYSEDQWNGSPLPYATADLSNGPFRDRIYATWIDHRSGKLDVLFAYSTDKGKTWSSPRVINDDHRWPQGGGPDALHGIPAVSPTGVVGVMWYDRRDQPDDLGWDVRFRASFDGGETFTPSVKINTVSHRPLAADSLWVMSGHEENWYHAPETAEFGVHSFNFSGGHTAGLAADAAGVFHPLWIDNRTGVPQLWTARVTVTGTVAVNGGADMSALVDASKTVDLRMTNTLYHRKTGLLDATVALENLSAKDTAFGPFKLRVLDLRADVGTTTITNADAGGTAEGAVWDFSALISGGRLGPHEKSKPRTMTFHLADPGPIRPGGPNAWVALAHFNSKVLVGRLVAVPDSAKAAHGGVGADPEGGAGGAGGADPDGGRRHDSDK